MNRYLKTADGSNAQLAVSGGGETLEFRSGISFISEEQAEAGELNLAAGCLFSTIER